MAIKATSEIDIRSHLGYQIASVVYNLFLMGTSELALDKQDIFFHLPSPHLTLKRSRLKKVISNIEKEK